MRLVQLNDELLNKIEDHIKRGLPEYSVCKLFHISQSAWQLWKKNAKDLRIQVQSEFDQIVEQGFVTSEGIRLNFVIKNEREDVVAREATLSEAKAFVDSQTDDLLIVDESDKIERLIQDATALTTSQQNMMRLLEICEAGKELMLLDHIDNIKKHSRDDWKASAWFIERRARREFGRQETVVNKNLNVDVTDTLSDEEAQQFKDNLSTVFPNLGGKE